MLNYRSGHPQRTKVQTMRNLVYTAVDMSSSEELKQESRERALEIAENNGFSENDLEVRSRSPRFVQGAPCLRVPFISDDFGIQLQRIFRKYGITVNIIPKCAQTLKQILVRSRIYDNQCNGTACPDCIHSSGTCKLKGVVYEIECSECGEKYIGETGRFLVERIKEHLSDLRHYENRSGPWAVHRRDSHAGTDIEIKVSVRAVEQRLQERKIKEAMLIKTERPSVNARAEMVEVMKFIGDA